MEIHENVPCPFCGTVCDDIICKVEGDEVVSTVNACRIGHAKFVHAEGAERYKKPMIRKSGEFVEVSMDEAIDTAASILVASERPLMYGWSCTDVDSQGAGVKLAEEVRALVDNTATVCHGPSLLAVHDAGYPVSTLGEARNRADIVIYWGCNPMHAHPRHVARNVMGRGFFRERGIKDRTVIVVDPRKSDTAKLADIHVQLEYDKDYELLNALRTVLQGKEILYDTVAGVPRDVIKGTVEALKGAQFGLLFFGMGITQSRGKNRNIDAGIRIIQDLNAYAKFTLIPMRGHYNVNGFNQVCTWETGYPFCVDFADGSAKYNPGETGSNDLLNTKECDGMMVVASDPGAHFPQKALQRMAEIPVIAIEPHRTPTTELADVIIPPAIVGVEAEGTAYRMDSVPMKMKKMVDTGFFTDRELLTRILTKVRELKASK